MHKTDKKRTKKIHISPELSISGDNLSAPIPKNEKERLSILYQYLLLDSSPYDESYDRFTTLCHRIFKVKAVSISLVDADNLYLKSKVGLPCSVTDRHTSFAAHAILPQCPDLFEVKNALEDVRFSNNFRVVGFPFWRFYAGVALVVDGVRIGSLSIMDTKVRPDFNKEARLNLLEFASCISNLMTMKRNAILHIDRPFQTMEQKILSSFSSSVKKKKMLKIKKDSNKRSVFPQTDSHPSTDIINDNSQNYKTKNPLVHYLYNKHNISDHMITSFTGKEGQSYPIITTTTNNNNNNNHDMQSTLCQIEDMVESLVTTLSISHHDSIELEWSIDDSLSTHLLLSYPTLFHDALSSILLQASDYWQNASISLQFISFENNNNINPNTPIGSTSSTSSTIAISTSGYLWIKIQLLNPVSIINTGNQPTVFPYGKIEVRHIEDNLVTIGGRIRKSNIFNESSSSTSTSTTSHSVSCCFSCSCSLTTTTTSCTCTCSNPATTSNSNSSSSKSNASSSKSIHGKFIDMQFPCDLIAYPIDSDVDDDSNKNSNRSENSDKQHVNNNLLYHSLCDTKQSTSSSLYPRITTDNNNDDGSISLICSDEEDTEDADADAVGELTHPLTVATATVAVIPTLPEEEGVYDRSDNNDEDVDEQDKKVELVPSSPSVVKPALPLFQRWRLSLFSLFFPNNATTTRQQQIRPFVSSQIISS